MMKRILVVEDETDMIEILKIAFRDSNYDVIFSSQSLENSEIQLINPDLILLDVRLLGSPLSGADICKSLKSTPATRDIPVVLVSGEYDLAKIAAECQADYFIEKPYNLFSLLLKLRQYLR